LSSRLTGRSGILFASLCLGLGTAGAQGLRILRLLGAGFHLLEPIDPLIERFEQTFFCLLEFLLPGVAAGLDGLRGALLGLNRKRREHGQ